MNNSSIAPRVLGTVAALGAAAVATQADAAVIFTDFSANSFSAIPFNVDGVYINIVTGAAATSGATLNNLWDVNPYFITAAPASLTFFGSTAGDLNRALVGSVAGGGVTNLAFGTPIGLGLNTFTAANLTGAQLHAGGGYMGFRFTNEATGLINYAWAQFTSTGANPPTAGSMRLVGFAYENTGAAILTGNTGAIPEPSTVVALGMMAAGALGLRQWRSRKAA